MTSNGQEAPGLVSRLSRRRGFSRHAHDVHDLLLPHHDLSLVLPDLWMVLHDACGCDHEGMSLPQ